jgi:hypothetical protein
MSAMDEYYALAKAMDVDAALARLQGSIPRQPRNAFGQLVTPRDWVTAGLHTVRACYPGSSPEEVEAAKAWLTENGWTLPA